MNPKLFIHKIIKTKKEIQSFIEMLWEGRKRMENEKIVSVCGHAFIIDFKML